MIFVKKVEPDQVVVICHDPTLLDCIYHRLKGMYGS